MTNRDKISNEKLARMIIAGVIEPCNYCILKDGCCSKTWNSKSVCIQNIEFWLSEESEKIADEMFEKLGYKQSLDLNHYGYVYDKKDEDYVDRIVIEKTNYGFYYIKHRISYTKYFYDKYIRSKTITEEEDKAIHKKIEELKGENRND